MEEVYTTTHRLVKGKGGGRRSNGKWLEILVGLLLYLEFIDKRSDRVCVCLFLLETSSPARTGLHDGDHGGRSSLPPRRLCRCCHRSVASSAFFLVCYSPRAPSVRPNRHQIQVGRMRPPNGRTVLVGEGGEVVVRRAKRKSAKMEAIKERVVSTEGGA